MPMYDDDYEDEDFQPRRRRPRVVVVREKRGLNIGALLQMTGAKDLSTATDPAVALSTTALQSAVRTYADKLKTAGLVGLLADGGLSDDGGNGALLALALTGGI